MFKGKIFRKNKNQQMLTNFSGALETLSFEHLIGWLNRLMLVFQEAPAEIKECRGTLSSKLS